MSYFGNCTMDDIVEELFGDVSAFACVIEEHGDNCTVGNITITYDAETDIHSFYVN